MKYQIKIEKDAQKFLKKLPRPDETRVLKAIAKLPDEGDRKQMKGHLTCLKYLQGDMYKIADVKNGRIKIPLNACGFQNFDHGTLRGNLLITLSSSVGEAHMPESTARLIFKL